MKPEFRPIPISLLDFFAILIPGLVWLVLVVLLHMAVVGPLAELAPHRAWGAISDFIVSTDSWINVAAVLAAGLIIGYGLKPVAMPLAGRLTVPIAWLSEKTAKSRKRHTQKEREAATDKSEKPETTHFPFNSWVNSKHPRLVEAVQCLVNEASGLPVDELPGTQPFSSVKRLLRLRAPGLWEETERMETEVRMLGALFLAALGSVLIAMLATGARFVHHASVQRSSLAWLILSAIGCVILGIGYVRIRKREVLYTYLYGVLALTKREQSEPALCPGMRCWVTASRDCRLTRGSIRKVVQIRWREP